MINSRDLSLLRDDVEANVHIWLRLCETEELPVLITQTVRDDEYQTHLYAQGRTRPGRIVTNSKRTTFHGAGLAVDFCKNVRGEEYSDRAFFERVIAIAKKVGFSSGADWKRFPEQCHLQWDEGGKYQFDRAKGPKKMPLYEEDEMITVKSIETMDDAAVLALANRVQNALGKLEQGGSVGKELAEAVEMGITDGNSPRAYCTRAQAAVMIKRVVKGE
ncbi:MAG: M15 family metallopeptidase [Oscillospiraceae bacterium]|nr:M15 family metallopeptidase [Oscillospiraceae bacterium]